MSPQLIASLAFATAIFVSFTKFPFNRIQGPNQNQFVRLYVYAVAIVVCALYAPLPHVTLGPSVLAAVKVLIPDAFTVGTAAILSYHAIVGLPGTLAGIATGTLQPVPTHPAEPVVTATPIAAPTP